MKMTKKNFSCSHLLLYAKFIQRDKMTSQATSVDLDPIATEEKHGLENRTSSGNYDLKFGMCTYSNQTF